MNTAKNNRVAPNLNRLLVAEKPLDDSDTTFPGGMALIKSVARRIKFTARILGTSIMNEPPTWVIFIGGVAVGYFSMRYCLQ